MGMTRTHNYYDSTRGWEHTNSGWYEFRMSVKSANEHLKIVNWMYENIDNPERHCRWQFLMDMGCYSGFFKFRYEKDYIFFKLRWS